MAATKIHIHENDKTVSDFLCKFVVQKANQAIQLSGTFSVGLSGGSLAKFLCEGLPSLETDWSKWRVFFCDERHVSFEDTDCTYKYYKDNLFGKVPLSDEHIYKINPGVTVEKAAEDYLAKIRQVFPGKDVPRFDMLLLGMGPDGHTCSLFPGHPLLKETKVLIAPISDSPKPPPKRITMTFPVVNNAACCVFASCGGGKAEMIQRVLEGKEAVPLPAARVRPKNGELHWFLDVPAASLLQKK
ncbi:6-phosphogluconolactonase-like [Lineus longissimus]|uniref:6-phosphogluconolactonase-like n=1 Tax=Lineus longissimus TaxID=88925 RepID=UPI002B4F22ED